MKKHSLLEISTAGFTIILCYIQPYLVSYLVTNQFNADCSM